MTQPTIQEAFAAAAAVLRDRPRRDHAHSASCTAESCGVDATFVCDGTCLRAMRLRPAATIDDVVRTPCRGHRVPTREQLLRYSLQRKGLTQPAPRGAPIEDDMPNTWSNNERDGVAHETRGRTA